MTAPKSVAALRRHQISEPEGLGDLVRRMDEDYQVKLANVTLQANAKQAAITITADQDSERAAQVCNLLSKLYWRRLNSMLQCVRYGRVAYEQTWGAVDGVSMLELLPLPYHLSKMRLAVNGEFQGIEVGEGSGKVLLQPPHCWWLALDPEPLRPHGRSRYMGAPYKTWKDRQEVLKLRKTFVNKFIFRGGFAHIPMDIREVDGRRIDPVDATRSAYEDMAAGGIMILSNSRQVVGPERKDAGYEWDFSESKFEVNDSKPISEIVDAMDSEQLLAFGIPPKTVIEGDAVGSFAMVSQQMLILLAVVEDIVSQIVESYQSGPCADVAKATGIGNVTVNYTPLTNRPDDLATELVRSWLTTDKLSPILLSGAVDVSAVLDAVGVPVSRDGENRIVKMIDTMRTVREVSTQSLIDGQQNLDQQQGPGGKFSTPADSDASLSFRLGQRG